MTSRTLTFAGFALVGAGVVFGVITVRRHSFPTLGQPTRAFTRTLAVPSEAGPRLGLARLAPLRTRYRRVQMTRSQSSYLNETFTFARYELTLPFSMFTSS